MKILLDETKNFYKANLHCHSTNSDGALTPAQLKEEYKSRGYSVLAITDHEHLIDNSTLNDDEFLTITSCELAIKEKENASTLRDYGMKVCHLNVYSLDPHNTVTPCYSSTYDHFINENIKEKIRFESEYEREYSLRGINDIIKTANENGFIVSYNHPNWSLENATQYLGYEGLFAVEIYNHGVQVNGIESYSPYVFDDFLREGKKIFCTMCDDAHSKNGVEKANSDMFGGWVMINAEKLDYKTIMKSLICGDFYASQGPEIKSLILDGDTVKIKTSPAIKIFLTTKGRRSKARIADRRVHICEAEFKLCKEDEYFRLTVIDGEGNHANTQAYNI